LLWREQRQGFWVERMGGACSSTQTGGKTKTGHLYRIKKKKKHFTIRRASQEKRRAQPHFDKAARGKKEKPFSPGGEKGRHRPSFLVAPEKEDFLGTGEGRPGLQRKRNRALTTLFPVEKEEKKLDIA